MTNLELLEELFEMEVSNTSLKGAQQWIEQEGSQELIDAFYIWSAKQWDSVEQYLGSILDCDQLLMLEKVKAANPYSVPINRR